MTAFIRNLFAGRTTPTARKARLAVEGLETRWCPAVAVTELALPNGLNELRVTSIGDAGIKIDQNDAANVVKVTEIKVVQYPNGSSTTTTIDKGTWASNSLGKITLDLGDGDDDVTYTTEGSHVLFNKAVAIDLGDSANETNTLYVRTKFGSRGYYASVFGQFDMTVDGSGGVDRLNGTLATAYNGRMSLTADLGGGDDIASLDLGGAANGAGAVTRIELNGGAGGDYLGIDAESWNDQLSGLAIDPGCRLDLIENGGTGSDTLYASYKGVVKGTLNVRLDGNFQSDARTAPQTSPFVPIDDDAITGRVEVKSGSTGSAAVKLLGGIGDDTLKLTLLNSSAGAAAVTGILDGGAGNADSCNPGLPPEVQVYRCEIVL